MKAWVGEVTCYNRNMDSADARAYLERWRDVERVERLEAQTTTIQDRWRQLNALKLRAARLGIERKGDEGEMEIFLMWANLRTAHAST